MDQRTLDALIERARIAYRAERQARHGDPYGSAEPDRLRYRPAHSVRCVVAPWWRKALDALRCF